MIYLDDWGAAGDGVTDDTDVFQRAVDAAAHYDGQSTVVLTSGKSYRTTHPVKIASGESGVTIGGDGTWTSEGESALDVNTSPLTYPAVAIAEADADDTEIVATEAHTLEVGDVVIIYTGQAIAESAQDGFGSPDSELNIVTSVNGSTIGLQWPLAKNYRQEYFEPGETIGTDFTSTTYLGDAAPLAVRKINPVRDVVIDGITINHSGAAAAIVAHQIGILGFELTNVTGTAGSFFAMSAWRGSMTGCTIHVTTQYGWWVTTAYGSRDVTIDGNTFTADTLGYLHIHEGSSNIAVSNTTCTNAPGQAGTSQSIIGLRGRGYNITLDTVTVTNAANHVDGACLWISDPITGSAVDCVFDITGGGSYTVRNFSAGFTVV